MFLSFLLSSCGNSFTIESKSTKSKIQNEYNCSSVHYSIDYSLKENLVVIDLCGCSKELNIDSTPKHEDLIKQIGEKAYNECVKKNALKGVLVKVSKDSTHSKMRYYKYKLDDKKSLILEEDSGIR